MTGTLRCSTGTLRRIVPAGALFAGLIVLAGCQTATSPSAFVDSAIDPGAGSAVNIGSLTSVIAQNPSDANAYNVRGSAYGDAGKFKEAKADFDTAIRLNPNFYQAYANRANAERRLGRDGEALNDYNRAIQINPNYDVAYIGRGNLYRQGRRPDLALADFNQAIALDTRDPRAYHNRGLLYQASGQQEAAIRDFSRAIALSPTRNEPFEARGLSYLAVGNYKAALDDFNEVLKRDRESYIAWTNQGLALEKLGETGKAYAAFAKAASLNPRYGPATEGVARTRHAANATPTAT